MSGVQLKIAISVVMTAGACLLCAYPASAHLVTTGLGPVYDGIGHLVLTLEDLVPVIALALLAGLGGAAAGRRILFLLPVAWLAGGIVGTQAGSALSFPVAALSFLVLGLLTAADLRLPAWVVTALGVVFGLMHGLFNGIALREGAGILGLLGIASALFVLTALMVAFVVSLRRPWTRIAVRVAGSWVAAMGLLMIGWTFRA
jgi:hydrogenase/urease accessory protein HupE